MSFDDILGMDDPVPVTPAAPVKKRMGRPPGSKTKPKPPPEEPVSLKTTDLHEVIGGVSIPWLVKVFRMGRTKVEEALRDCPALMTTANGGLLYDLPTAAAYLVAPTTNLESYLKTLKPNQLPEHLRSAYWDARTKEAKFKVMAGDLWPTEAILEVLGETFKTIKVTTQLWTDTIDETTGLNVEQRNLLVSLTDRLMGELHVALVEQAKNSMTESWLKELDNAPEET